ncbi:hypothetical protein [Domibacillus robiginosus]|uniref:hypothetical protein n=1 Tax=Domibacillus robiginosus TaxID=1071054 RepID=UPI00067DD98A|nr:hypothetical protein [Domibacillus robiginosus]
MDQEIRVSRFVGVSYTKGKIAFGNKKAIVPYELGFHGEQAYHVDMQDLRELMEKYPDYLNSYNKQLYMTRSYWGQNNIEVGLCWLMKEGRVTLRRQRQDIHFTWVGPDWNPDHPNWNHRIT